MVFAHLNFKEPFQTIIYSFHMPLFFCISGMLFCRERYRSFGDFLKRRFRTLLAPYLLFAVLSLLYSTAVQLLGHGWSAELGVSFLRSFGQIFIAQRSTKVVNVPLWFVPCLFLTECLYYAIAKLKSRPLFFGALVGVVAFGWFSESRFCPMDFSFLPWNFSSACFALGFYAIGNLAQPVLSCALLCSAERRDRLKKALLAAVCLAALIPPALFNGHVSIGSRTLGNGFLFYLTGLLGTAMLLLLGNLLQNSRLLTFWGRSSFYIMATHKLVQSMIFVLYKLIWHGILEDTPYFWGPSLLILLLDLILCTAFSYAYLRFVKRRFSGKTA